MAEHSHRLAVFELALRQRRVSKTATAEMLAVLQAAFAMTPALARGVTIALGGGTQGIQGVGPPVTGSTTMSVADRFSELNSVVHAVSPTLKHAGQVWA